MKKIDTSLIKSLYVTRLKQKQDWFDRLSVLIAATPTELVDLNLLCENYLTAVYVEFECLVSDLFHGYINNDSKQYMSFVANQIETSVAMRFSPWHAANLSFAPPKHLDASILQTILDPTSWNITFKDMKATQDRAREWLAATHAKRFASLSASDVSLVDAAHAIRNRIAHNSSSSAKVANTMIRAISTGPNCPNAPLATVGNSVNTIGKYLRASTPGGVRAAVYASRLAAIGAAL